MSTVWSWGIAGRAVGQSSWLRAELWGLEASGFRFCYCNFSVMSSSCGLVKEDVSGPRGDATMLQAEEIVTEGGGRREQSI